MMKHLYLLFAIIGLILPFTQLVPFIQLNGMDMVLLFEKGFANNATTFFMIDLLLVGTVASIFIITDGKKNSIKFRGFAVAGVFLVGICFGLPLYLYLKEKQREV